MGLETLGHQPGSEVQTSKEVAVPAGQSLALPEDTTGQGITTLLPDTYPSTSSVLVPAPGRTTRRTIITTSTPRRAHEVTDSQTGHRDIVASPEEAAGIIAAIAIPTLRSRPDASVTIMDVTGIGAGDEVVRALQRRGFPAEVHDVSPAALLENATASQFSDLIAARIAEHSGNHSEGAATRGVLRAVTSYLARTEQQTADAEKQPIEPYPIQVRNTLAAMLGREVPGMDSTKAREAKKIIGQEEFSEQRHTVIKTLNAIDDLLEIDQAMARPVTAADASKTTDTRDPQVISLRVTDPGIGEFADLPSMVSRRMTQTLRAQQEPGVPRIFAVAGAEKLSAQDLERLGKISDSQGVETIFAYSGALKDEHLPLLMQRGPMTFMATPNGITAEGITRVVGQNEQERQTGRSISTSDSLTVVDDTTEVTSTTEAKKHKHRKDVTPTVSTQKTHNKTETRSSGSDAGDQFTIGQFNRIEPGEAQDLRPGEAVTVRRGQYGLEAAKFSLPRHADVGLQLPFREQLRMAFPDAEANSSTALPEAASAEKPLPTSPVARWKERTTRMKQIREQTATNTGRSKAQRLREAGLSWETFVTPIGDLRVPDLDTLPKDQKEAIQQELVGTSDAEIESTLRELGAGRIQHATMMTVFSRDRLSASYVAEYRERTAVEQARMAQAAELLLDSVTETSVGSVTDHTGLLEAAATHAIESGVDVIGLPGRLASQYTGMLDIDVLKHNVELVEQKLQSVRDENARSQLTTLHAYLVGKIVDAATQEQTG